MLISFFCTDFLNIIYKWKLLQFAATLILFFLSPHANIFSKWIFTYSRIYWLQEVNVLEKHIKRKAFQFQNNKGIYICVTGINIFLEWNHCTTQMQHVDLPGNLFGFHISSTCLLLNTHSCSSSVLVFGFILRFTLILICNLYWRNVEKWSPSCRNVCLVVGFILRLILILICNLFGRNVEKLSPSCRNVFL